MAKFFRNKYRIESIRKKGYDYSRNGLYFITICAKNRYCYFGRLVNQKLDRTALGCIAEEFWWSIPKHFPFVHADAFVLMPDHLHGILCFDNPEFRDREYLCREDEGQMNLSGLTITMPEGGRFGPQTKNLGSVIRNYKGAVTSFARKNEILFNWQAGYHDRIINSPQHLAAARIYIRNNPKRG